MRNILLVLVSALLLVACQFEKGYTVTGTIAGDVEGARVYLKRIELMEPVVIDSAVITNGHFEMKGRVDYPGLHTIVIDCTPAGEESDPRQMYASNFYLENSDITYQGDIATLPGFYYNPKRQTVKPVIVGSKTQDLSDSFAEQTKPLLQKARELDTRYMQEYLKPYFDEKIEKTELGIDIVHQEHEVMAQLKQEELAFIQANLNSVVALDKVKNYFQGMYVDFTVDQIDEMTLWFEPHWGTTPLFAQLKEAAQSAKRVALGEQYKDIELLNEQGELVKLSSVVDSGKYVMLEFWASWCGPCRGEIPHLRRVNEAYAGDGFKIVSISVDSNDKEWLQAVGEENMSWTQLRDPKGMEGAVRDVYNVYGVPTCIILNREGRIYKTNMRGAYLDAFLVEAFQR